LTASTERWRTEAAQPSATQWMSMLARSEVTARELAEHYLKRIAEVD
jgi:Asp-tRNA(Asn)/Glu-tRNA(Gln) amidotransferase A subunit family amidase